MSERDDLAILKLRLDAGKFALECNEAKIAGLALNLWATYGALGYPPKILAELLHEVTLRGNIPTLRFLEEIETVVDYLTVIANELKALEKK